MEEKEEEEDEEEEEEDNDDSIRCIESPTFNDARARVKIRKIISTVAIEYYCIFIF